MSAATTKKKKHMKGNEQKRTHEATKIKVKYQIYIFFHSFNSVCGSISSVLSELLCFSYIFCAPFDPCVCVRFPVAEFEFYPTYLISFATFPVNVFTKRRQHQQETRKREKYHKINFENGSRWNRQTKKCFVSGWQCEKQQFRWQILNSTKELLRKTEKSWEKAARERKMKIVTAVAVCDGYWFLLFATLLVVHHHEGISLRKRQDTPPVFGQYKWQIFVCNPVFVDANETRWSSCAGSQDENNYFHFYRAMLSLFFFFLRPSGGQ